MYILQCQKFGEYHKDDPSSFKFNENFSLYPQVSMSPLLFVSTSYKHTDFSLHVHLYLHTAHLNLLFPSPVTYDVLSSPLYPILHSHPPSSCSTCDGRSSYKCSTTALMRVPTIATSSTRKMSLRVWS